MFPRQDREPLLLQLAENLTAEIEDGAFVTTTVTAVLERSSEQVIVASRIAWTGPPRSERASPMGHQLAAFTLHGFS